MIDESPDRGDRLVLGGPPPGFGRPSWKALLVAVVVALLAGVIVGYRTGAGPIDASRRGLAATLSPSPTPSASPSATPAAIGVYFGVEASKGILRPGTYVYLNVDQTSFTNVSFTVPAGWTWSGRSLSKGRIGAPSGAVIYFYDAVVQVYGDPCHWAESLPRKPTGSSAAALIADLAAQPLRKATVPRARPANAPGIANGWQGLSIQLVVPDNITFTGCDEGQYRSWGPDSEARSNEGPGQRDLVWAIDLGPYDRLIIDAAWFLETPAQVQSEIQGILGSIAAGHWG